MIKEQIAEQKLNTNLEKALINFFEYHPSKRVNRYLRAIWMEYLEHSIAACPSEVDEKIYDINSLMELLDKAEDETKDWHEEP